MCSKCGNEGSSDGAQPPVQSEFTNDDPLGYDLAWDLTASRQERSSNGRIKSRTLLRQFGRGQPNSVLWSWPLQATVEKRRSTSIPRLAHELVGQADDRKSRNANGHVRLDVHDAAFNSE
jgi:hypothetical protein